MIGDRNLSSHIYDRTMAEKLVDNIRDKYVQLFEKLAETLENKA